jgi:hypothetical protein
MASYAGAGPLSAERQFFLGAAIALAIFTFADCAARNLIP